MRYIILVCLVATASINILAAQTLPSEQIDPSIELISDLPVESVGLQYSDLLESDSLHETSSGDFGGESSEGDSQTTQFEVVPMAQTIDDDRLRYFSFSIGPNILEDAPTGFAVSGAIGRRFGDRIRWELEFARRSNSEEVGFRDNYADGYTEGIVSAGVGSTSIVSNVFYDFKCNRAITPYIGAGIGLSSVDSDFEFQGDHFIEERRFDRTSYSGYRYSTKHIGETHVQLDDRDTVFAYQFAAGISGKISPAAELFLEYRFLGTADVEMFDESLGAYTANSLMFGVRGKF